MRTIPDMHDFIGELPEAIREEVLELSSLRKFKAGEAIYRQGDAPNELYRLNTGGVKLCNYSLDGKEFLAGEFRPGDCFGEMGMIDRLPRISNAIATQDSTVSVFSRRDFEQCVSRYPQFSRHLMEMLCRRIRFLYSVHEESRELSLQERLALTLYRLALGDSVKDEGGEGIYVRASQEELGRLLGVSRQSINKTLRTLVDEGSVKVRYGKIFFRDIETFRQTYDYLMHNQHVAVTYSADSHGVEPID